MLNDGVQHGAAPNEGFIARVQESHGHQRDAISFERLNTLADGMWGLPDSHHERDIRAIDIGIEEAGAMAEFGKLMARLTATVLLPTPPLPEPTAMMFSRLESATSAARRELEDP